MMEVGRQHITEKKVAKVTLRNGETLEFSKGGSIFIPANCGEYKINGEAKILETRV